MDNQLLWHDFYQEINQPDEQIDLAKASLCYAQAEYPELDIPKYLKILDGIAKEVTSQLVAESYPLKVIKAINFELFDGMGFQGNQKNYYNPENSFLNRVIATRVGIPITLSVIYLAVAKRLDFPMVGIGMPGHFLIRPDFEDVGIYVDPFNRGEILFQHDCQQKLSQIYQQPVALDPSWFVPVSNKQILARMLNNLKFIYLHQRKTNKALAAMSGIIQLLPDNAAEIRDRGLLYYQTHRWQEAAVDLEYFLKIAPHNEDVETIKMLLEKINQIS